MSAYATVEQVEDGFRTLTNEEQGVCETLLTEIAVLIDAYNENAELDIKQVVSCRAIRRALTAADGGVPFGATQGSMSALGYSQSWTIGSGGSVGELYLSKLEKSLLGVGNRLVASYTPAQNLIPNTESDFND